jgi:hypothetical protein
LSVFFVVVPEEPALSEVEWGICCLPLLLPVLFYPQTKNRHFDRSGSQLIVAAQWRNPFLYHNLPTAKSS